MLKSPQGAAGGRRAPHRLLDKLVAALAASALAFSLGFAAVAPAADSAPDGSRIYVGGDFTVRIN